MVWYYIRQKDGLIWYATTGRLVTDPILAVCISDNLSLWHAKVIIDCDPTWEV